MKSINKKELHQIFSNLRGDKEKSFNELYEKYSKLIYAISFSILKNKENSEDIMQTVFTKIYNINSDKLPTSNEASWLYTLTKNESINLIRKQKNKVNLDDIADIPYDDKELENIIEKDAYNKDPNQWLFKYDEDDDSNYKYPQQYDKIQRYINKNKKYNNENYNLEWIIKKSDLESLAHKGGVYNSYEFSNFRNK